jgi:glycosyltransferase involved in cell wall biosynthesis
MSGWTDWWTSNEGRRLQVEEDEQQSTSGRTPTLGVVVTVFRRPNFYLAALRSAAAQVGRLPQVEFVVVRSPDVHIEIPPELEARGWPCTVVRSDAIGEGPFLADGLTALTSDFLLPLDDDDMWAPERLSTLLRALEAHPNSGYYHNGQRFVDAEGAPLLAGEALRHLRRFSGEPRGQLRELAPANLRRRPGAFARRGSFFNNSSVAVRRSALVECLPELRATARMADSFMFYAAVSSGETLLFDPARTTTYRIHSANRSREARNRGSPGPNQPSSTREGRMASIAVMRAMVERRRNEWLETWLDRDRAYIDLLEGFREGDSDRGLTLRRALRLARYAGYVDPLMNAVLVFTACGLAAAPSLAHRVYWAGNPPPVGETVGTPGS